ncbi:Prominin-1, partial [Geodia barretti]
CGSGLSQKAEEEFSSTHSTLEYDYLNAVNETIRNIVSSGGHIDNARDEVHDALKYLDKYEAVWNGVGILLACLFFLIVVVFVVGSFCGSFGYSREAQPNSRSSVSNCGGRCILGGIFIGVVSSPVLLMTATVSFGLATGVQKLCEDLQPPNYPVLRE